MTPPWKTFLRRQNANFDDQNDVPEQKNKPGHPTKMDRFGFKRERERGILIFGGKNLVFVGKNQILDEKIAKLDWINRKTIHRLKKLCLA
jgi:hypothetical protein